MRSNTQACYKPVLELAPAVRPPESSAPVASDASVVNDEDGHAFTLLMVQLGTH
jgi:hypothetical protein